MLRGKPNFGAAHLMEGYVRTKTTRNTLAAIGLSLVAPASAHADIFDGLMEVSKCIGVPGGCFGGDWVLKTPRDAWHDLLTEGPGHNNDPRGQYWPHRTIFGDW
jgi:hypothetical protein